jgi:hypothetical protein
MTGDNNDRQPRMFRLDLTQQLEATAVGQSRLEDDKIYGAMAQGR